MRQGAGYRFRLGLVFLLLFSGGYTQAQLSVTNDLHPDILAPKKIKLGEAAGAEYGWRSNGLIPGIGEGLNENDHSGSHPTNRNPKPFDFSQSAPHLAFFCRLEINEKAGFVIPAKFRLGGHTHWQDNLGRRD